MSDNVKVIIPRNEVVLIDSEGNSLYFRPLEEGEKLVDVGRFNDFVKPLFNEDLKDFVESATPQEIAAARPTPQPKETPIEETLAREIVMLQNKLFDLEKRLSQPTV